MPEQEFKEFKSADYNVVDIYHPFGQGPTLAQQYYQTGRFFAVSPETKQLARIYIQFGDGSPDFSKALRVYPGDTFEFSEPFRRFFVWIYPGQGIDAFNVKFLIGNKRIKFQPSPQVLNQEINLQVEDFSLNFDRSIADIAFFEKPFIPTNPDAKLWRIAFKQKPNDAEALHTLRGTDGAINIIERLSNIGYGKTLTLTNWMCAAESPRPDKLIDMANFPPGSLIVLVCDYITNANLITNMVNLQRKGNNVTDEVATRLVTQADINTDTQTRPLLTTKADTENINGVFKMIGSDTYSPLPNSILGANAIKALFPDPTSVTISGSAGKSRKSLVYLVDRFLPISPLDNSINALCIQAIFNWLVEIAGISVANARLYQWMGDLIIDGWIANPAWLRERLGGWYM